MLDPLRQAKPEVPAKPTRPQNTTKNCLSFTHKAKDHRACYSPHGRGEAHLAQSSQGTSHRSYNEGQGRPLTRKTNLVNDAISLRLPLELSHPGRAATSGVVGTPHPMTNLPYTRARINWIPTLHLATTAGQPDLDKMVKGTLPTTTQADDTYG